MENVQVVDIARGNDISRSRVIPGVNAYVIDVSKAAEPGKTQQVSDDPIAGLVASGKIIEPPFDLLSLAMLPEINTELGQCIDAMAVNIDGFGYRFVPRVRYGIDASPEIVAAVDQEQIELENFFNYVTIESYVDFRRNLRKDLEATGNCFYEVIRDSSGNIQSFSHIPSYQMRLGVMDEEPVLSTRPILITSKDKTAKIEEISEYRRFRRYAQLRGIRKASGTSYVSSCGVRWYKEFGDRRNFNRDTGDEIKDTDKTLKSLYANEIVHHRIYSPRTPYGLPRTIGILLSIYGARAAEEINFITFKNNNIPSMIIAVSNGQLTQASVDRIKEYAESIRRSSDYSKFLVLEAETNDIEGEDGGQTKIDIKPLTANQHKDALFQNYSSNSKDNVRRAFRLPPIFVGRSDEYTRSTAESSRVLADEQIFAPERDSFDSFTNRILFPEMGIVHHKFKSNSPNTTDNQQLVWILAGAEKTGGMTPRIARMMLEDVLGIELPKFTEEFNPDVPFSLTMAEAVKNMAQASEPGQQVTALKNLIGEGETDKAFIEYLLRASESIESRWADGVEKTHNH